MAWPPPPKGSKRGETHSVITWRNGVKRRVRKGRDVIDKRCAAGQVAIAMRDDLIAERGGADSLGVAELAMIELVARDTFFVDEIDRRIMGFLQKVREHEKEKAMVKNPKALSILYSYRQSAARNLAANLQSLGLSKPAPKIKTLDEILAEDDDESNNVTQGDK